jgi:hypothetical protein
MPKRQKVVAYAREREAEIMNAPYDQKFASFIKTLFQAKIDECDVLLIAEPWVIGDTYDEIIESLSRLAESKIGLLIVGRRQTPWTN